MKKIIFLFIVIALCSQSQAQEFAKRLTEAKTAYSAGKLDDSRFAMEQMLQELDIITGKEVLKILHNVSGGIIKTKPVHAIDLATMENQLKNQLLAYV